MSAICGSGRAIWIGSSLSGMWYFRGQVMGLLLVVFLSSTPSLMAQALAPNCIDMVRSIAARINALDGTTRTVYLSYTVHTVGTIRGKAFDRNSNVELIANRSRMQFKSSDAEIYQDASVLVMVMPGVKSIYVNRSDLKKLREERQKMMMAMQDSLFTRSDLVECVAINDRLNHADRRMTLKLRPGARQALGIASITYLINTDEQSIRKTIIRYDESRELSLVELTINKADYDYKAQIFGRPVTAELYDDGGHLLPKYRGYNVIDSRNRN